MSYIQLGDTVQFGITVSNPSGSIANLINTDVIPRWFAYTSTSGDNPLMQGNFIARANLIGTYTGSFACTSANNFLTNDYVEVHASGLVNGVQGRTIVRSFRIDDLYKANVIQVSGVYVGLTSSVDANVTTISGVPVGPTDDVYYAAIKFIKDSTVPEDEYSVHWFKNSYSLPSGSILNPAISVYNTNSNASLFTNKILNYQSVNHGGLRYNETTNLAISGEAYIVITSGTINGAVRNWTNIVGLDYL
jgi:uncharacterized repeat protein (TIGR01451 family)